MDFERRLLSAALASAMAMATVEAVVAVMDIVSEYDLKAQAFTITDCCDI
jgi:hypothetical protein